MPISAAAQPKLLQLGSALGDRSFTRLADTSLALLHKASDHTTVSELRNSLGTDQQKTQQRRSDCQAWPASCRGNQAVPEC